MGQESDTHHEAGHHEAGHHEAGAGDGHEAVTNQGAPSDHGVASDHGASSGKKDMHAGTSADGGAHNDVGFPPFKPENFAPQLIWLTLTFTVLYLLMSRIVLPRIGEIIEERNDRIKRDLETAERLKSETEKALNAYEQALSDARSSAGEIAKETRDKLAGEVALERARVDDEINTKVSEAEAAIAQTQQKALASVNEIAGDVAGSLVAKLIGKDVSADEIKAALNTGRTNS